MFVLFASGFCILIVLAAVISTADKPFAYNSVIIYVLTIIAMYLILLAYKIKTEDNRNIYWKP